MRGLICILHEMHERGVSPTMQTLRAALQVFARGGAVEDAEALVERWCGADSRGGDDGADSGADGANGAMAIAVDEDCLASLLQAYATRGDAEGALSLLGLSVQQGGGSGSELLLILLGRLLLRLVVVVVIPTASFFPLTPYETSVSPVAMNAKETCFIDGEVVA